MRADSFRLTREDGAQVHVYRWLPDGEPKAAVQIAHGLAEHAGRYARLAEALTKSGYAVYASDHRGHGLTAASADFGHFSDAGGWDRVLGDLWALNRRIAADLPGRPIVYFGHSMGSFLGQAFIAAHGDALAGCVLSGSNGAPPAIANVGRGVARFERWRLGGRGKSALLQKMMFGEFNKKFSPARTEFDWLSRDQAEVDAYVADPLCGFPFTTQLAVDLLDQLGALSAPATVARIPKTLPILIFSGARDPVGANVQGLIDAYRNGGLLRVTSKIYPDGRHEMLNETNRDEVTADILAWLDGIFAR
ncbi:MAG: alpha/beta hydrolase [Hyphomicrobiales bacterium]|nr:alpha/beta hydrolase [Hyphomicrobiales bacterium]